MLFNSYAFLLFFPVVCMVYFLLPARWRNGWLLAASYYFYMSWNAKYALLLASSTLTTYVCGLLLSRENRPGRRKMYVGVVVVINFAILVCFKYSGFLVDSVNELLSLTGSPLLMIRWDVLLPVGISFYTFQAIGYMVDVYRRDIDAERSIVKYALFVSFFPQLVAGPIERSRNLLGQFSEKHAFDYDAMKNGLILMLWGYFQKVVVADRVAVVVDTVFNNYAKYQGLVFIVALFLFAIQIYCDFAGYSNIAKGAAQIMGFRLMDNFRQPYLSSSMREFWKRWHISLSTWFKDYLYIPLGGNRVAKSRHLFNLFVTFLISGLWHGAGWNFIAWGALHGVFLVTEELLRPFSGRIRGLLKISPEDFSFKFARVALTFVLVDFAWLFFRARDIGAAYAIARSMFGTFNPWIFFDGTLYKLGLNATEANVAALSIIVLVLGDWLHSRISFRDLLAKQNIVFRWAFYYAALFGILIFGHYGPTMDASQFIYFQF